MAEYQISPWTKQMERVDSKVPIKESDVTSDITLGLQDEYIPVDASSGSVAVTLPYSTQDSLGKQIEISKRDSSSNTVVITCQGTNTINGASTMIIQFQYNTAHIVSSGDGTWSVI